MIKQLFSRKETATKLPQPLPPGKPAPDFSLPSTTGEQITLSDLRGRPVVLVFYPADHSSVCSNQLALYNEALHLFREHDAHILGISVDDMSSHQDFARDLKLNFPLLSDTDPHGAVSRAYGVYSERDNNSERALFVIDADGVIRWSYVSPRGINPGANGILEALESLPTGD
jgi:peroxiredoxin